MRCSVCEFEWSGRQAECPRCSYRRYMAAHPTPVAAAAAFVPVQAAPEPAPVPARAAEDLLPASDDPEAALPVPEPLRGPHAPRRMAVAGAVLLTGLLLLSVSFFVRSRQSSAVALAASSKESRAAVQIRQAFARYDPACRSGDMVPCMAGVNKMRAFNDRADSAFLLAALRVAQYLRGRPNGEALLGRWEQDQLTDAELSAYGNTAYQEGSRCFRGFWLYANCKRNHLPVPEVLISRDDAEALRGAPPASFRDRRGGPPDGDDDDHGRR